VFQSCPCVQIDGSTKMTFFISKESSQTIEIFTSRVTDSSLRLENKDDFIELPIPEQFKTTINGIKTNIQPVVHA
jgi:adenylyl cyclase-associated protein